MNSETQIDMSDYFLGLDVQVNRACPFYILNRNLEYIDSGWLKGDNLPEICSSLQQLVYGLANRDGSTISIGIDAPRIPLPAPRAYYWKKGEWAPRTPRERGYGRHCEVVIKALNIANPQWTPLIGEAPPWMELGFALFRTLEEFNQVYEVFPTASYRLLENTDFPRIPLAFEQFAPGPKDMLDAAAAAYTTYLLAVGNGCEVGGGDGLGTIALPTRLPVPASHPVLTWPG